MMAFNYLTVRDKNFNIRNRLFYSMNIYDWSLLFLALLGSIVVAKQKCDSLNKAEFIFRSVLMQRETSLHVNLNISAAASV